MSGTLLEAGVIVGLALANLVKLTLRYGWRRVTAPKGQRRG